MTKLNFNELADLQGGDYCSTLVFILSHSCISGGALAGALYGWNYAGCGPQSVFDALVASGCGG